MWKRGETVPAVSIGEVYGYRARSIDDLVPVKVLKEGAKKPARVLVRFEDPAMEGREEWVPPARLKVYWSDVDDFRAEEARWNAVEALSPHQDSAEVYAAEQVCELLVDDDIAGLGYKDAHLTVHDVAALAALARADPSFVTSHEAGFQVDDEGPVIVPWPVAVELVKKILVRDPDPVLSKVEQEEATARYEAIHGHEIRTTGRNPWSGYLSPEKYVEFDQDSSYGAPKRALLRSWAGEAAQRWDELVELRKEIKRVGEVAERAIEALRQHGHSGPADRLASELGMTVEMLRHGQDS